ncbi:hypothetical protein C499_17959 [Halogeometricum borinquense DSM 11551]|uniref:Exonuclease RecJ n=1 Tax=Halogeometricum borinquense (strain ATCC 700274 / DSM 11551 / JCM 10706 / KCTC 4070 / PR3) TaxID=469382 RepID=E4NPI8_HALBP|nr:hypothetical protein [Halogeometricum borinquense]ADQ67658.1 hypothetical protein Hbor_20940 [Halogeometricum borinquense DSM 11551]ELY23661.1 hypothetical protein C499_17959 [Halogeometricum borinquense DSM 11551]
MSAQIDPTQAPDAPAESVASALADAAFVRVVCRADGDALAAGGLLARALRRTSVPFHVRAGSFVSMPDAPDDDGVLLAVGTDVSDADATVAPDDGATSRRAYEVAAALTPAGEPGPDPVLALAGIVAAGEHPGATDGGLLSVAEETGAVERRPGIAAPVADLADGLAHTTLAHASFSGDREAVTAVLADLDLPAEPDDAAHRTLASLVALDVAGDDDATVRAAESVERAFKPYATPDAPFTTLGGYADVLDAVARERPGTGVALALGHETRVPALEAWRDHAAAAHRTLSEGHTGRYEGVHVVRATDAVATHPGRLATVARLARDFRSPEPMALVIGDGVAALAAVEHGAARAASAVADEFGGVDAGAWSGDARRAVVRFDADTPEAEIIAAVREAST